VRRLFLFPTFEGIPALFAELFVQPRHGAAANIPRHGVASVVLNQDERKADRLDLDGRVITPPCPVDLYGFVRGQDRRITAPEKRRVLADNVQEGHVVSSAYVFWCQLPGDSDRVRGFVLEFEHGIHLVGV